MSLLPITCAHCAVVSMKEAGGVNRSQRAGLPLYCGRVCSGLAHRKHRSRQHKIAEKAAYDRARRAELGELLLAQKRAAYHSAVAADAQTVRAKQKEHRAKRKLAHLQYCRRPEYRKWKAQYDRWYLAHKQFGAFGEAAILLRDLETEVLGRASRYEIALANGTLNKRNNRRRDYDRQANCR